MKEQILQLRAEGKTYKEIISITGASKSTISYHCGVDQKEKTRNRAKNNINTNIGKRIFEFKKLKNAADHFGLDRHTLDYNPSFTYKDVISKFGIDTNCYLTGEPINLYTSDYHFDHIVPFCKSSDNSIDNLGIATAKANRVKSDLTVEELIEICIQILSYNGYKTTKLSGETADATKDSSL